MSYVSTAPDGDLLVWVDEMTELDPGQHAHIVKTMPGENASAKVLEARINGTPVEALCGYVWVPSRDPRKLPLCPKCDEIYRMHRMMNEDLRERPSE